MSMAETTTFVMSGGAPFRMEPKSDANDPLDRAEEDLTFGARDSLEAIRKRWGIVEMLCRLPDVAAHFEVDEKALGDKWASHYGPGYKIECGEDPEIVLQASLRELRKSWPPLQPGDRFVLWALWQKDKGRVILTRGRTPSEATFRSSGNIVQLPVEAPEIYKRNHAPGWLHRPMYWLVEALGLDPREHGHG